MVKEYKSNYPYLSNTTSPHELLGLSPLMNSFAANLSAQRGTMYAAHLPQAQYVAGAEMPHVYSGYEHQIGQYEYNTTDRDQDIQVVAMVDKFIMNNGIYPVKFNPYYTIIYIGANDNKVGYMNLEQYTQCSDGYGYKNKWVNTNLLNKGNYIPKEIPLSTSPAWDGKKYMLGTHLETAYMSDPRCTEDAFIISDYAAEKLAPTAVSKISISIHPDQLLLNMAGPGEIPKFFPDVGEEVADDGIVIGLRKPNADSIISDTYNTHISSYNPMHDQLFHVPPGAKIIDVDVVINRKCKTKTPRETYQQIYDYREHINAYNYAIWEAYQQYCVVEGREATPAFNTLVVRAVCSLLADNVKIPGYTKKSDITLYKKKDPIPFIYITLTYAYKRKVTKGFKLTDKNGGKGTVAAVIPRHEMPVDDYGNICDIINDPIAVISRMNKGQMYEHMINHLSVRNATLMATMPLNEAWAFLMEYLRDCNPNYASLINDKCNTDAKREYLINDIIRTKVIYIQMHPCQSGIDTAFVNMMVAKYNLRKTPVTFTIRDRNNQPKIIRTKEDILIGGKQYYLLYKMPDSRAVSASYINMYNSPMKASALVKLINNVIMNPGRAGEDEMRIMVATIGAYETARVIGLYCNSPVAKNRLHKLLLTVSSPANIKRVDISTEAMVSSNNVICAAQHIFSTMGINTAPNAA